MARYRHDPRVITLRWSAVCDESGVELGRGTNALWYPLTKKVYGLESAAYRRYLADLHDMEQEDAEARRCFYVGDGQW